MKTTKDNKLIACMDALFISSPLVILFFILMFDGQPENIWSKTEWSFITIFYFMEVLRDQSARQKYGNYSIEHSESGNIFYSIILIIGVLTLSMDFKHSIGDSILPITAVYISKFAVYGASLVLFVIHRYKKYQLIDKYQDNMVIGNNAKKEESAN